MHDARCIDLTERNGVFSVSADTPEARLRQRVIERAARLRVSAEAPREIFLRQNTAVQACAADDGLAAVLMMARATIAWRSPKSPGGDHPLVVAALIELGVPASALSAGAP